MTNLTAPLVPARAPHRFLTPRLIPEKAVFRPALASSFMPGLNGQT